MSMSKNLCLASVVCVTLLTGTGEAEADGLPNWCIDRAPAPCLLDMELGWGIGAYQGRYATVVLEGVRFGARPGGILMQLSDGSYHWVNRSVANKWELVQWSDTRVEVVFHPHFTASFEADAGGRTMNILFSLVADTSPTPSNSWRRYVTIRRLPRQGEWHDANVRIYRPSTGSFRRLNGAMGPSTVINRGGRFHLYFVGAIGDRDDGGPARPALHVATSWDGINFDAPRKAFDGGRSRDLSLGVYSAGAVIEPTGRIRMYYGRCSKLTGGPKLRCDIWTAVSGDGIRFTGHRRLLSNRCVAADRPRGCGQQLLPVGVHYDAGTYYVAYIAKNGAAGDGELFAAVTTDPATVSAAATYPVLGGDSGGGGNPVPLGMQQILLHLVRDSKSSSGDQRPGGHVDTWTANGGHPWVTLPSDFGFTASDLMNAVVYHDRLRNRLYMYDLRHWYSQSCGAAGRVCHRARGIGVRWVELAAPN